jgi:suppressor for copper-sensitivity B
MGLALLVASAARAQEDVLGGLPGSKTPGPGLFDKNQENDKGVVTVTAQFTAPTADKPGRLFVTARIEPKWHIYSITQPTRASGNPPVTKIDVNLPGGVRMLSPFRASVAPKVGTEPEAYGDLPIETHDGTVTWYAPIELAAGVDAAKIKITGGLSFGACDASGCRMPERLPFAARLGPGIAVREGPATSQIQPPSEDAQNAFDLDKLKISANDQIRQTSMLLVILTGFAGGLLLNLMPCVLPVIGLKLLSFIEQAGHSRGHALALNVWYSLGLISVFLVLATLAVTLGLGWGQLFSFNGFNITLAAVVFAMGLSFLGVWEVPIPGFVGRGKTLELGEKEGAAGAFAKGVLTTLLATPCSAPFLASALTWAVSQPPAKTYTIFTAVGLGMASPYLLIGAFPSLIAFLPKPGAWMDTFKQIMGFVLLGTVVFVLTFIPWPLVVPTVGFLFALWGACWWIGRLSPLAEAGVKAWTWIEAAAFAGVMGLVAFTWLAGVMQGYFDRTMEQIVAERLGQLGTKGVTGAVNGDKEKGLLPWQPFTRKDLQDALTSRSTVLVDFTADWCLTCKTLETAVLNTREVADAVKANGVLVMHADWTHGQPEVTRMLELLGSKQVPVLAIFPAAAPDKPIVLRGGYTKATLLEALKKAGPSKKP